MAATSDDPETSIMARPGHVGVADRREQRRAALLRRYAASRDRHDLERLVIAFRPLARALARRYSHTSPPSEDLEQVAYEGLIKAIQRYDPERGTPFVSFAVPTILGQLRRFLRDTAWPAHVPRPVQERVRQLRDAAWDFSARYGRPPTARDLAAFTGCDLEEVVEALNATASLRVASLDAPAGDGDDRAMSAAERIGTVDDGFERVECLAAIEQGLPALPFEQREALRLHFGEELTSAQIARRLGVSRSRAARDVDMAVSTLRELQAA